MIFFNIHIFLQLYQMLALIIMMSHLVITMIQVQGCIMIQIRNIIIIVTRNNFYTGMPNLFHINQQR